MKAFAMINVALYKMMAEVAPTPIGNQLIEFICYSSKLSTPNSTLHDEHPVL